jgi:predicted aspartyl protease
MLKVSCGCAGAPQAQALLIHHGPAINVSIGFDPNWDPKLNAAPAAGASSLRALIDTGARQSCIDSELALKLSLPHFDRKPVSSVGGIVMVNFHLAQVHVPSLKFTQRGPFAAVPLIASGFKYEALLGRSFLSYVK